MANLPLKLVTYPWDYLTPLALGDVKPEGIDLTLDQKSGIRALGNDPSLDGGETSLGLHMLRTSQGNRDYVGFPMFIMRAFRHRCFLVKRGSPLVGMTDLRQLEGKRVGIDGWPNSGNTWTRLIMRQDGVDIWKVDWTIAPVDQPGSGTGDALPGAVRHGPVGKSLVDLTVSGELDVMVTAFLPPWFYAPDSPVVHMIPDFPAAEEAHMRRVGYMPAHHLLTIRRDVFEANPWIARSLTDAFQACKDTWQANRRYYGDTTPFGLAEIERSAAIFGDDWNPYGLEANLKLLTDFTQDQLAQGLVTAAVNPREAFADYTRAMGG